MTRYIHYPAGKNNRSGLLISRNADESANGYSLGLEIECDRFEDVLSRMLVAADIPLHIDHGVVTNENIFGFTSEFMRVLHVDAELAHVPYRMKIHRSDMAVVYQKTVE